MNAKITIGIPVYNEEIYLRKTLNSILNQTSDDFQVLISNNGSTDKSLDIIHDFVNQDSRFTLYNQQVQLDPTSNFLFLLNKAKSPYFMWLGGHDYINEEYIKSCVDQLEKWQHCALASGRILWQQTTGGPYIDCNEGLSTLHMPGRMGLLTWLWSFYSCFQAYAVFRTNILKDVGISSFYSPDVAMIADVLLRGNAVFCGDAVYYATRNRSDESMKNQIRRYAGMGISDADLDYLSRDDARMGRFLKPCRDHILNSIRQTNWSWWEKHWTSAEVRKVFSTRLDYIIS